MKAVILAGGLGTRISEESHLRPKPMITIGDKPILWHIMKGLSVYGIKQFIICAGYKSHIIKEYFANYGLENAELAEFDLISGSRRLKGLCIEDWKVTVVETGLNTNTGGRLKKIAPLVGNEPFLMTYGDGVANINIHQLQKFHIEQSRLVTLTAVRPPGRFGALNLQGSQVTRFEEKPRGDGGFINGGYFIIDPTALELISDDSVAWEQSPLQTLAQRGDLSAFQHEGFWHSMDSMRDRNSLESLWATGNAPWKIWEEQPSNRQGELLVEVAKVDRTCPSPVLAPYIATASIKPEISQGGQ
jgi:glucose-1-phosphate cytidylyltransferase